MTTQVRFGGSAEGVTEAGDDEFLAAVKWRSDGFRQAMQEESPDLSLRTIGLCWKQQCSQRSVPDVTTPELSTLNLAIQEAEPGSVFELLRGIRKAALKSARKKAGDSVLSSRLVEQLEKWLRLDDATLASCPLSLLGCVELLVLHARYLSATTVGLLWKTSLAAAVAQADTFEEAGRDADWEELVSDDDADQHRWLQAGLLPWACGLLFDDVKGAPKVLKAGRRCLVDQLLMVTDEDGVPVGPVLETMTEHLARWKDAFLLGKIFERPLWKDAVDERLADTLETLAATLGADGRICGCLDDDGSGPEFVVSLAKLAGVKKNQKWLRTALAIEGAVGSGKSIPVNESPKRTVRKQSIPSWQSDDAEAACLRTSWAPADSVATLTYHEDPVAIELVADGTPLLVGSWGLTLTEDGEDIDVDDAWECVCWYSDEEVDYCELQLEFDDGSKLGRFVMLPRGRQFALLADVVQGSSAKRLELRSELPLADGVDGSRVKGSREWRLKTGRDRMRVYPLNVPQDAGIGTANSAEVVRDHDEVCFVTNSVSETGAVFSPVLIDWASHRRKATSEWSPLTVSEVMQIDREGAAAWRLRFGSEHLVLYRALRATERYRTFLGYQTEHETVVADFTQKGDLDEILLVE